MRAAFVLLVALIPAVSRGDSPAAGDDAYDLEFLKEHAVKHDTDGLLAFFRARTLTDEKIKNIRQLIQQMGHARFQVRDKAARELSAINAPAVKYLQPATRDNDPEIADRARRLIEDINNGPGSALPIAAVRQLRRHTSDDALPVLLDYLPFADDVGVEDAVLDALRKFGQRDGKADKLLVEALQDGAAAPQLAGFILGRSPVPDDRCQARQLLQDAEPWVRLRTAEGLLAGCDQAAVPALIALLHPAPDDVTWRSEELLRLLAGEQSPVPPADRAGSRMSYVKTWTTWWEKAEPGIDLAKLSSEPPVLGLYVGIEYNTGKVWECGRDGKRRWTVQAEGPMDAQVLPGNRVLIAEQIAKRVTERDLKGNILWQYATDGEAQNCQRLSNGNTFIATRNDVMEIRPNKSVAFKYKLSETLLHGVRRISNGHFLGIASDGVIKEMDPAGKIVRTVKLMNEGSWGDVLVLPGGRYLVANYGAGYIREVDAAGKTLHELKLFDPCGLERLPNGQMLVSGQGYAKIIDWTGKSYWESTSDGCVRRIHRR